MPTYKLTYFATMGNAEPIRYLLAYGNINYEEDSIKLEDWPKVRDNFPVKRLPIFEIDGKEYMQSSAIARYFAKQVGLAGKDDLEDYLIDQAVDTIVDIRSASASYFWDQMAASKESKKLPLQTEKIPSLVNYLENLAKNNGGYLALNRLTWADLFLAATIEYINFTSELGDALKDSPTLKALCEKVNNLPGIKEHRVTRPKTDF